MTIIDFLLPLLLKASQLTTYQTHIYQERCPNTKKSNLKVCHICEDSCPVDAITIDNTIKISEEKCIECGICSAQCPNEVFTLNFISDLTIYTQIFNTLKKNHSVIIECTGVNGKYNAKRDIDETSRVFVPCLGCLSEIHLLLSQSNTIEIEPCTKACTNYRGAAAYNKTTRMAEHVTNALRLKERDPGEGELLPVKTLPLATRRQFLNDIGLL
jgi:ferredoxin